MSEDRPIKWIQVVLAILIVGLGAAVVVAFKKTKPEPQQSESEHQGLLVQTQQVVAGDHDVHVRAQGQVMAARRVVLSPQVAGKITWVSDELVPGGRVARNARLLRLDGRDYQLAVQSRNADVNRASLELQLEQRRQAIAEREWNDFGNETAANTANTENPGRALALRQPQVENAEVTVEAAESAVQQARLNLQRTSIRAPFNAMVLSETVDVGQYVAPGSQLATLVGTDEAWVQVSLPVEALHSIRFPERDGEGSPVEVRVDVGGQEVVRQGRVLRLLPDLDASGGMARIIVTIEDPFALNREDGDGPTVPLLLGSFVTVDIDVPPLTDVVEVPRLAVREGGKAFVMNGDDQLEIRELQIVWGREQSVLVRGGLAHGERVITSRVPTPVDGMALREESPTANSDLRAEAPEASAR